ncbi:MAG TPA: alpha/beta fold hydrolase [Acidimicrobiales bacterium]|nr:alpha/beta fold hydrolase [Acidimicrobiales bacterium]
MDVPAGVACVAVGAGLAPHLWKHGPLTMQVAAVAWTTVGLLLGALGVIRLGRKRGVIWRLDLVALALISAATAAFVAAPAVAATHVPRPLVGATPSSVGLAMSATRLKTDDGVQLAAWYVASTNRAAVVLLHGAGSTRSNVLQQAAALSRGGFGVLMIDARGHGASGGRAMDFGWHGDADVAAALNYLAHRADVDPSRLGVVGLSMGGEEAIGASGSNDAIRAVVAEGATGRVAGDHAWLSDAYGVRGTVTELLARPRDWVTGLLTDAPRPQTLRAAAAASAGTKYLLITGGRVADERYAADYIASGAPTRTQIWTIPGAGHTAGMRVAGMEWERRVVAFLRTALRVDG